MLLSRRSLLAGIAATPCAAIPIPVPATPAYWIPIHPTQASDILEWDAASNREWAKQLFNEAIRETWEQARRPHSYVREQSPDVAAPVAGRTETGA